MHKPIIPHLIVAAILLITNTGSGQLAGYAEKPSAAKIVYQDLFNFIQAHASLAENSDSVAILQTGYIDKATPGLKIFIEKYGLTAQKLSRAINRHPADYNAIEHKLKWLQTQEDSIRQYFAKCTYLIPDIIFPPTYYLVDMRRGIGSGSTEGQLITIEKEAKNIIDPGLKTHIIHELIHLNQLHAIGSLEKYLAIYNSEKSLLAITLREGVAEFFSELITGRYTQDQAYFFTRANERQLWKKFNTMMYGRDTGDWMWKDPENPAQPRDVAYVLGALIVEHYYKHSLDINRAVSDILSITNYRQFLQYSGYANKFD